LNHPADCATRGSTDGYIGNAPYPRVGWVEAAIAVIVGAILIAYGLLVEWVPCSGWGAALLGLGLICFGIAIAVGLVGSWVFPALLSGAGAILLLYGLTAASAAGCLPKGI
jgi:hypothetical protein